MIFIAALGLNVIINYPLSAARFWIFGFLISLIWILVPLRSAVWRGLFVVGMTMMQFTIFPWYSQITRGKGLIGIDIESIRKYLHHGDFDGFQTLDLKWERVSPAWLSFLCHVPFGKIRLSH